MCILDALDRECEIAMRRTGARHNYTTTLVLQAYGPVRFPLLIPVGKSHWLAQEVEVGDHLLLGGIVDTPIRRILADFAASAKDDDDADDDDLLCSISLFK